MNKPLTLFYLLLFVALVTNESCRTTKDLTHTTAKIENLNSNKLLDSISKYQFKFEYFASKLSTDVVAGELDESFKTNLKIRKDSAIWMSISVASITGYTAIITNDTVMMLDRRKKQYFQGNLTYINEMFNTELDYKMMQDLLVGNLINFDPQEKYKSKEDTAYYFLSTVGKRKLRRTFEHERLQRKEPYVYRYWLNPGTFRPAKTIINDLSDSTSLEVNYLEYEWVDSVLVPAEMLIIAASPGKSASIRLKFSHTKVNEFSEFTFKIPDGYDKME